MNVRSIARPYAKAAFECAHQLKQLTDWSTILSILADAMSDPNVIDVLKNPELDSKQLAKILIDSLNEVFLPDPLKNLIRLLAEKQRLIILPELFQLFEEYRTTLEKTVKAEVISAYPLDMEQQDKLATALKIRLQRNVTIDAKNDPNLIGGAIIKVGDLVIDGSVNNTLLNLLRYSITS